MKKQRTYGRGEGCGAGRGGVVSSSIKGHSVAAHSLSLKVGESFADVCGFGKISRAAGDGNRTQLLSSARKAETQTRLLSGQLSHAASGVVAIVPR